MKNRDPCVGATHTAPNYSKTLGTWKVHHKNVYSPTLRPLMHLERPKSNYFLGGTNITGRNNLERPRAPKGRPKHYKATLGGWTLDGHCTTLT